MNNNRLDDLFKGLTGTAKDAPQQQHGDKAASRVNKASGRDKTDKPREERFCTIVNSDLLRKIRIIASREGLQIKDVVNAAFDKAVKTYERRNGAVEGDIRGNAKNLF